MGASPHTPRIFKLGKSSMLRLCSRRPGEAIGCFLVGPGIRRNHGTGWEPDDRSTKETAGCICGCPGLFLGGSAVTRSPLETREGVRSASSLVSNVTRSGLGNEAANTTEGRPGGRPLDRWDHSSPSSSAGVPLLGERKPIRLISVS